MLNIALPKGRLGEKVYSYFKAAGYECPSIEETNRKLIFENPEKGVRYFWVKPSDVAIYVERGAADIGVAGKDILLEYEPDIYELLDLNVGKCRMYAKNFGEFFLDQVKTADTIIFSRTQMLSPDRIEKSRALIEEAHPGVRVVTTAWDELPAEVMLEVVETGRPIELHVEHHHHHDHDEECECGHHHHHDHHHECKCHHHHHHHH